MGLVTELNLYSGTWVLRVPAVLMMLVTPSGNGLMTTARNVTVMARFVGMAKLSAATTRFGGTPLARSG